MEQRCGQHQGGCRERAQQGAVTERPGEQVGRLQKPTAPRQAGAPRPWAPGASGRGPVGRAGPESPTSTPSAVGQVRLRFLTYKIAAPTPQSWREAPVQGEGSQRERADRAGFRVPT